MRLDSSDFEHLRYLSQGRQKFKGYASDV